MQVEGRTDQFAQLNARDNVSKRMEPKKSSTLLLTFVIVLVGLALINVFARQGRKPSLPAPVHPKPTPASSPKRSNNRTVLASNAGYSGAGIRDVAQVSNLLYRRFSIGWASERPNSPAASRHPQAGSAAIQQVGNPRYTTAPPQQIRVLPCLPKPAKFAFVFASPCS